MSADSELLARSSAGPLVGAAKLFVAAGLLAAHTVANAWFFFVPTGAIVSAIQGDHCVPETAKPGDKIRAQGRDWIVKSTSGVSSRCAHTPQWPVVAKLEPIYSEAELNTEQVVCVQSPVGVGTRTTVPRLGEVEVRSIGSPTECSDQTRPIALHVVHVQPEGYRPEAKSQPEPISTHKSDPAAFFAPSEPANPKVRARSTADRLRELKQLRDENLITQEVYEAKQKDILADQ